MSSASAKKKRGVWLSIWLVLIMLHGLLSIFLILGYRQQPDTGALPWYISALSVAGAVKIVAAVAIWMWEKWGLYLYVASILVTTVIGLLLTGTLLIVFNDLLPLAILGWFLTDKWSYFE